MYSRPKILAVNWSKYRLNKKYPIQKAPNDIRKGMSRNANPFTPNIFIEIAANTAITILPPSL